MGEGGDIQKDNGYQLLIYIMVGGWQFNYKLES